MSTKPSIAMTEPELRAFVSSAPYVVVGVPDGRGGLVVRAARHSVSASPDGALSGAALALGPLAVTRDLPAARGACAITDTNLAYGGIKGALMHGSLEVDANGARLKIARASGFDFAKMPPTRQG